MKTTIAVLLATVLTAGSSVSDVEPVEIREWPVPWEASRPRDPFVDSLGRVWFVGQRSHYAAHLIPETGEFRKFDLDVGTGPHNLIVGDDGTVWYAGNAAAHIGKLDPQTGAITKLSMPESQVRDPHTLTFDREGDIWFTAQQSNYIGKVDVESGEVRLIRVPTANSRPYGIVVDNQNRPWFNEFGTNKIGTVDPRSFELKEYALPHSDARGRRIAVSSERKVWYADYARGSIGVLDPNTGDVREWQAPGGPESRPYAMALDSSERVWVVETGTIPNRLIGFDPRSEQFFSITSIPSGGGSVRHMVYHRPSGSLWFGTDANTIGQARIE